MTPSYKHNNEKVAIVTGASQGIGAGITKAYRELGYVVIATARSIGPSEDPGIVTVGGVTYLESAPFVTGEVLCIDGGQSAGH